MNEDKTVSQSQIDELKQWEGFSAVTYCDAAGKPTIGYGHLLATEVIARFADRHISEQEAEQLLRENLKGAEDCVRRVVAVPLTQDQYDTLVDFVFNLGCQNLLASDLLAALNQGAYDAVPEELMRWNKALVGEVLVPLQGLTNRRAAEVQRWTRAGKPASPLSVPARVSIVAAKASHNNASDGADNLLQAFDGDPRTRWSTRTAQVPGMWFQVDIGSPRTIAQLKLSHGNSSHDYARGCIVAVSSDEQTWQKVAEFPENHGALSAAFAPLAARYIRTTLTGADHKFWWSIHEIYVAASPPLAVSASHNNVVDGSDNLLQALDDNPATRWSTRRVQMPGMWFEIDLGLPLAIRSVQLDNAGSPDDYPHGYAVELSTDGQLWAGVASCEHNNAPLSVSFESQTARLLRITLTESADKWWSIHDITIELSAPDRKSPILR